MPTYNFRHKKTGKTKTEFMSISAMEAFIKAHPEYDVLCGVPGFHTGQGLGIRKIDSGFKDVLGQIKKNHPRSTINSDGV